MTWPGGRGSHPSADLIADLDAGLLGDPEAGDVAAHIDTCPTCRDGADALDRVRADLAALPSPQLPADIAARLEAALAAAAVPSLPERRAASASRFASTRAWILATAAAAVLVVAGGVGLVALRDGTGPAAGSAGVAGAAADRAAAKAAGGAEGGLGAATREAPPQSTVGAAAGSASGRDYTAATLPPQVPAILQGSASSPGPTAPVTDGVAGALARLREPAALAACVTQLTGSTAVSPLALDYARFEGQPALIVIFAAVDDPGSVDVSVVGPGCGTTGPDRRYAARLARSPT